MAAKTKSRRLPPSGFGESQHALMSLDLDISTGSGKLRPEDLLQRERPASVQDSYRRARLWSMENWFVGEVIKLKLSFYNFGLRLKACDSTKHAKLAQYLQDNPEVEAGFERYVEEVWREWFTLNNVISFWRQENKTLPILLSPEDAKYTDALGRPKLTVNLGYQKKDAPAGTAQEILDRYYTGKPIELDENWDEYFDVLTTQRRGKGFGYPDLYSVFRTLSQVESNEIGEQMLALAGRRILHRHKIGFEQRGQNPSKFQQPFSLFQKKRADAIIAYMNGRFGLMDTVNNFDHAIEVFLGDGGPKNYDGRKWDTTIRRLMWWGGPLGFMMVANSMNPFLLNMLKTSAIQDRKTVGRHLNLVLNAAFKFPTPVKVVFSNRCFIDARLAWDMVSTLLKQGPLSNTTALTSSDFDVQQELENKRDEAKREADYLPLLPAPAGGASSGGNGKAGPKTKKEGSTAKPNGQTSGARGK